MYLVAFFFLWQKSSRYTLQKTFFDDNTNKKTHKKHTNKSVITFFFSLSSSLVKMIKMIKMVSEFRRRFLLFVFVSSFRLIGKKKEEEKNQTC